MKKLSLLFVALSLIFCFSSGNLSAKGIGIKGGYLMPQDDLDKVADKEWNFGIYLDMGDTFFPNLAFRPSLDYVTLKKDSVKYANLYGIHFDWYWHFMGVQSISPFIGFGPSLNYYSGGYYSSDHKDSDAGVDLFLGVEYKFSSMPLTLMLEGRFKFLDIADRGMTAGAFNLGIAYNF